MTLTLTLTLTLTKARGVVLDSDPLSGELVVSLRADLVVAHEAAAAHPKPKPGKEVACLGEIGEI